MLEHKRELRDGEHFEFLGRHEFRRTTLERFNQEGAQSTTRAIVTLPAIDGCDGVRSEPCVVQNDDLVQRSQLAAQAFLFLLCGGQEFRYHSGLLVQFLNVLAEVLTNPVCTLELARDAGTFLGQPLQGCRGFL